MRVSEHYRLGVTQASLDFVDVDIRKDVPVFIDPAAIRLQTGDWAETCQALLQSFFSELLTAIKAGDKDRIASLVLHLGEPNETHLGVSSGDSKGRGLGNGKKSQEVVDALANSVAGKTGLLRDLEETAMFVNGVGRDIISDITTNIIRGPLVQYTQSICRFYNITLVDQYSGFMWDPSNLKWKDGIVQLPRAASDKLLLVPRSIVRIRSISDGGKYYRGFIRPYFEAIELDKPASQLVTTLKDGRKKVLLAELDDLVDTTKTGLVDHTLRWPDALPAWRDSITAETNPPLDHEVFEDALGSKTVDYQLLLDSVKAIGAGAAGATSYHRAVAELLTALFDAALGNEHLEDPIHDGRKRLDIRYDNISGSGFFAWLSKNYAAATIVVECKNYKSDPKNPELDQLSGRFSPARGEIGLLVCRKLKNKDKFNERCRDTAKDGRGYILALDDDDLKILVDEAIANVGKPLRTRLHYAHLREMFGYLIS